ncbi:amidophosphoribosyltransferase [Acidihalobacter aeolianus]|uniref:Amidophosphoribosyltransferase n=1 Tax=Acidihalobacter aeolianus TaxID=2792603 RepID=A0A1D8K8S4_9GAMM|nr:amidophosphoribosyltransferase [Acidihalobacter aeolianus]AOV17362.1 amidophosphoribosyltransferase [Acidihalobacter aeolianus]
MCGIIGIVGQSPVNQSLYDGLTVLQHRGQDAAGIVTYHDGRLYLRKGNGLVRDVFRGRHMQELVGNVGIGHVRYPTAGSSSSAEAQPFYVNSPFGITLGHNGNLINTESLKRELFLQDRRHINTESDSEVLLNIFAQELLHQQPLHLEPDHVFHAVAAVHRRCQGAYAVVAMINGHGILAFRDPYGIRPVVYGMRETPDGLEYMVASESVALDALGFKLIRDLAPGEAVYIDLAGHLHSRQCADNAQYSPCIFEYVYFARPDSIIDDVFVHKARMRMGDYLGRKIQREWSDHDIDVVIPIPETSRTSALELAMRLGVKYREGFIKNRYIARTFIMPGQTQRKKSVRQKLNPIGLEFQGKNVLLVDDSIVRGTTSREIVMMARDAGARRVYFASASPPVRYPNIYGIDMPAADELIAHGRTEQEVCEAICADRLFYQDLPDLVRAVQKGNPKLGRFDTAVFDGDYVTGVSRDYLAALERRRGEGASVVRVPRQAHIDLHNTV